MLFEAWSTWEEEKLGLVAGVGFVLIGVFSYLIYTMWMYVGLIALLLLGLAMASSGVTAVLFQLPRIRGVRAAISTFLGGITIGLSIILLVAACGQVAADLLKSIALYIAMGMEVVLSFFSVGFLILVLYPDEITHLPSSNVEKKEMKNGGKEKVEIDDDLFERL